MTSAYISFCIHFQLSSDSCALHITSLQCLSSFQVITWKKWRNKITINIVNQGYDSEWGNSITKKFDLDLLSIDSVIGKFISVIQIKKAEREKHWTFTHKFGKGFFNFHDLFRNNTRNKWSDSTIYWLLVNGLTFNLMNKKVNWS